MVVAQFLLQFLQHCFGQALLVRSAVQNLERGDFGFVLFNAIAERFQQPHRPIPRRHIEALAQNRVHGHGVDGLLGVLLGLRQHVTQRGEIERCAGFIGQRLAVEQILPEFLFSDLRAPSWHHRSRSKRNSTFQLERAESAAALAEAV